MLKNAKIQMLLVLVLGASIGYAAALGKLNPFQRADAGPPGASAGERTQDSQPGGKSACCPEGVSKGQLLALADPKLRAASNGKKPNIVFIMGDDIGMWNIGAYHRGVMAGRTPNLDKLAKEGIQRKRFPMCATVTLWIDSNCSLRASCKLSINPSIEGLHSQQSLRR